MYLVFSSNCVNVMLKAVIFDLHGTLIRAVGEVPDFAVSEYLVSRGYDVSPQQFHAGLVFTVFVDYPRYGYGSWREFLGHVLEVIGVVVDEDTLEGLTAMFRECRYELYPDALNAIPRVRELGLKTVVATTTPRFMFYKYLEPIEECLDLVVTGFEAGCDKSNPRMYTCILEQLGARPEEVVVVGDNPLLDVEIPLRLGMHAILLDRRGVRRGKHRFVVKDLNEAVAIIRELLQASSP
ncbi:MAG: hypothetical protein DRJ43_02655 [Thermoprotei archaeon]|nr:MAG: hypothetical protein DRJ43_02655 [Thermoprotei archaeon]